MILFMTKMDKYLESPIKHRNTDLVYDGAGNLSVKFFSEIETVLTYRT